MATLREQLVGSEEIKNRALEQVKALDSQKLKLVEESEERAKNKQGELEKELEDKNK